VCRPSVTCTSLIHLKGLSALDIDNPQLIIHRLNQVLLHAEVFLGGLDGGVAEQHLNLFEVASRLAA
jgi:hypothetical protein